MTKPLEAGQTYQISVQYDGNDALRDSGGGNYILVPRATWYPGNANTLYSLDHAIFDIEMNVDNSGKMDWFFNEWVYGTQIPAYKFEYQVTSDGMLSGKVTQSGVSDDFVMIVPIYLDMGKGWTRLGSARLVGNATLDIKDLKLAAVPKRVALCALNDVLATSIENSK